MSNRAKKITKFSLYVNGIEEDNYFSQIEKDFQNVFFILRKFPNYGVYSTAADYTANTSDYVIAVTDTSTTRTVTLPLAASMEKGQLLIIKDESGAAGTNNITVDGNGSETIDGATTATISSNYGSLKIYSNQTEWFTV